MSGLSFDAESAARLVAICVAIAQLLSAAQVLVNLALFAPNAPLDWALVRASGLIARTPAARIRSFGPGIVGALSVVRTLAALGLAAAGIAGTSLLPWTAAVAVTALLQVGRAPELVMAADHISNIVVTALALGALGSVDAMAAALVFIALQVCVVYVSAAVAKLRHPLWRNGKYLAAMVSTRAWGHGWLAKALQRYPVAALVSAWLVMLLEMSFPLVLVAPPRVAIASLMVMAGFHGAIAGIMGLNLFFFAFLSTYPAVLFLNVQLRHWLA